MFFNANLKFCIIFNAFWYFILYAFQTKVVLTKLYCYSFLCFSNHPRNIGYILWSVDVRVHKNKFGFNFLTNCILNCDESDVEFDAVSKIVCAEKGTDFLEALFFHKTYNDVFVIYEIVSLFCIFINFDVPFGQY